MTNLKSNSQTGTHFSVTYLGRLDDLKQYTFATDDGAVSIEGKIFLNPILDLTGAEISINRLGANDSMPFYHKHKDNEEIYIFIGGRGEIQIDGETIEVSEGTVVRIAPDAVRSWRNCSDQPLFYIVVQVPANQYQGDTITDGILVDGEVKW